MPRKRLPSAAGGNRTDLMGAVPNGGAPTSSQLQPPNPTPTQPVMTATGQAYGAAGAQQAAQRAVPLPQAAPPVAGAYEGSPLSAALRAMPFDQVGMGGPSRRPREPVTTGINAGAGAPAPTMNRATIADTLQRLAEIEPALATFANYARSQGV